MSKNNKKDLVIYPVKPDPEIKLVDRDIPAPLDKPPFVHLYIGSRGAGKTNAMVNFAMRKDWYGMNEDDEEDYVFDETIIISSTLGSDVTSRHLVEHATKTYDFYDDGIIANIINHQKLTPKSERRHIHIIADDIITMIKPNALIFKLTSNHRHYLTSLSFLVQAPKAVPPLVHNCCTKYFIFRNPSYTEQEKIFEKLAFMGGKHSVEKMYVDATREPYCFLVIDSTKFEAWSMGTHPARFLWSRYDENGNYTQSYGEEDQDNKKS